MDIELLIRNARLRDETPVDVAIAKGRIVAIARRLPGHADRIIEAHGGLLLPGLNDHHIHLAATAAAMSSIACGPPDVTDAAGLVTALRRGSAGGAGWLRGVNYHEGIAGPIDHNWIDRAVPDRPVRIQNRSGRMWYLNSLAIDRLVETGCAFPEGMECENGRWTGRLFDADGWLRTALAGFPPALDAVGAALAARGITGVTDMNPDNGPASVDYIAEQRRRGSLPQNVVLAGNADLAHLEISAVTVGPLKLHLHEAALPDFDTTVAIIRDAHQKDRAVAVHCVTEVELVFTLGAFREAGVVAGDRIEHASVATDPLVTAIAEAGLQVVSQPHFVAERGDFYRSRIPASDWPHLYRLRSFRAAGVVLAAGSDAPFGRPCPWAAMAAAVSRRTAGGHSLGADEALTPRLLSTCSWPTSPISLASVASREAPARIWCCWSNPGENFAKH